MDVNDICRQALQLVEREAAMRGVELELALQPDLPSIPGDAVQLQQAVLNLTINALDALFESFFSNKENGLGMGLSIVRTIVERHDGEVYGENNASGRARFTVRVPIQRTKVAFQPA